jgi:C4-dicarboxylate-specific signal transduction histidine kinase
MLEKWEAAYQAAMLETDQKKMAAKIDHAASVLNAALLELASVPQHVSQRRRIEDALRALETVRRIELQLPA